MGPEPLLVQMAAVWKTERFIEFDQHVHPQTLISNGVPQGCPLALLTLACFMASGHNGVNRLMRENDGYTAEGASKASVRIYMDDRSWIGADYTRALDRASNWFRWSASVGLQENPQWFQQHTVKVLGPFTIALARLIHKSVVFKLILVVDNVLFGHMHGKAISSAQEPHEISQPLINLNCMTKLQQRCHSFTFDNLMPSIV